MSSVGPLYSHLDVLENKGYLDEPDWSLLAVFIRRGSISLVRAYRAPSFPTCRWYFAAPSG